MTDYTPTVEDLKAAMLRDYKMFLYCPDDPTDCSCYSYRHYIENFFTRELGGFPLRPEDMVKQ
jgi:hypothetical protein